MPESPWKLRQAAFEFALSQGEEIAKLNCFKQAPVDPFQVVSSEGVQIQVEGDDFRDCFDGRLSYHNGRFLLIYNTYYNRWPHSSDHHPKVRFSVAHELGHYYLEAHRKFIVARKRPIESQTEFQSNKDVEREADSFATGLLLPRYLVSPRVNFDQSARLADIKDAAAQFDVSLTSMMIRWTQLSHFPCATLRVSDGMIKWGFISESLRECGFWRARRSAIVGCNARGFLAVDPSLAFYREGEGEGLAQNWLDGECDQLDVRESYVAIPYSQSLLIFICADERDIPSQGDDDD